MHYTADTLARAYYVTGRGGMSISVPQMPMTVAASQTIKKGDLLVATGGAGVLTVQQSIAAPSAGTKTDSSGTVAGIYIAQEPITTNSAGVETATGRTTINVTEFDGNVDLGLPLYHATPASAVLSALVIGTTYKFARFTNAAGTDSFYVAIVTTSGELTYLKPAPGILTTNQYGIGTYRYTQSLQPN